MGVSAGLLASCEKEGIEPGARTRPRQRCARSAPRARRSRRSAFAGSTSTSTATSGCSRLAAAPTSAPPSWRAARCCRSMRANCSAARSAARSRPGTKRGRALIDEVGELVVTEPMPSMPLYLWGDESGERLSESYFAMYPGIWRHGDWIRITPRGGAVIYGRSDSTINRQGVRMGTSEIYRAPAGSSRCSTRSSSTSGRRTRARGELRMILFVVLRDGSSLDETPRCGRSRPDPRGLLAAPRAQRDPPDRGGAAHAFGEGARGARQADPDGHAPRAGGQQSSRSPTRMRSTTSWSWRASCSRGRAGLPLQA